MFEPIRTDGRLGVTVLGAGVFLLAAIVLFPRAGRGWTFGAAVAAAAVFALARYLRLERGARRYQSTRAWLIAPGTVELVSVTPRKYSRRRPPLYIGELCYSYAASDTFYSSSCFRCFEREADAWRLVDRCRGQALRIRYDPAKPDLSMFAGFADIHEPESGNGPWLPEAMFERCLASLRITAP